MTRTKSFVTLSALMLCTCVVHAQSPSATSERETGFLRRSVTLRLTTIDYRVYVPAGYDPARKYPVLLYLHGRGARGNDNEKQIGGAHLGSVIQVAGRLRQLVSRGEVPGQICGGGSGERRRGDAERFTDAQLWKWLLEQRLSHQ